MAIYLMKESFLYGQYSSYDVEPVRSADKITESYSRIENYLKANAREIIPTKVRLLPLIEDGIISGGSAASCYEFQNALVLPSARPAGNGYALLLQVIAGQEVKAGQVMQQVKDKASLFLSQYWRDNKDKEVEVAEGTSLDDLAQMLLSKTLAVRQRSQG
jgi:hypothetical protein